VNRATMRKTKRPTSGEKAREIGGFVARREVVWKIT